MTLAGIAERRSGSPARPGSQADLAQAVWDPLAFLQNSYPGFRKWYWRKVVPELATGRRRLFTESSGGALVGIVIAKRSDERKLCTIWTAPAARGQGTATRLVRNALCWLGTDTPLLTVPEEDMERFEGLVRAFRFHHHASLRSFYRQGRVEHVFNGVLPPDHPDGECR